MIEHVTSRSRRLIAVTVLIALSGVLSGCGSMSGLGGFDPTDIFDFLDTKKKLPGDRKAVFPEGVPGLEQGVPKDLYRGARSANANIAPEPPPVVEEQKPAKRTASRPARQPVRPAPAEQPDADAASAADEEGVQAAPPAPPPPRRRAAQRQQPVQQEPAQQQQAAPGSFPAPLPSGSFSR